MILRVSIEMHMFILAKLQLICFKYALYFSYFFRYLKRLHRCWQFVWIKIVDNFECWWRSKKISVSKSVSPTSPGIQPTIRFLDVKTRGCYGLPYTMVKGDTFSSAFFYETQNSIQNKRICGLTGLICTYLILWPWMVTVM